jgi:hypothetical protein
MFGVRCFVVAGSAALLPIQNISGPVGIWLDIGSVGSSHYRARDKRCSELATTKKEIEARISA